MLILIGYRFFWVLCALSLLCICFVFFSEDIWWVLKMILPSRCQWLLTFYLFFNTLLKFVYLKPYLHCTIKYEISFAEDFILFYFLTEFIGATLVNNTVQVPRVQLHNASSVLHSALTTRSQVSFRQHLSPCPLPPALTHLSLWQPPCC